MSSGQDVQATFVAVLVDEWVRAGVTDVVLAPGSRSTPLAVAVAGEPRLRLHVMLDERGAGFFGVGLGLGGGRPAVVVTTSGTAAAELHASVVEAHQAGVPVIVVTADRPAELHQVGAPQTIEQEGLFGTAVRWAASPGVADQAAAWSWRSLASRSVAEAVGHRAGPGPVHLNLAFREPLLGTASELPAGRDGGRPWHSRPAVALSPSAEVVARLAALAGARGVIVAGAGGAGAPEVLDLAAALGWPVLADPRSGCRVPGPFTVGAADSLLRIEEVAAWRPEVVLRLGQPWASRFLSTWLAGLGAGVEQVLVDPAGGWADPERAAATVLGCDPGMLCRAVAAQVPAGPDRSAAPWARRWARAEAAAQAAIDEVLADHDEVTEPGVARALVDVLPATARLFVSSSMPVRDVEWFARPRSGLEVFANRGANGIDGINATALGLSASGLSSGLSSGGGPVVALVGDLAFLYDAGSLLGAVDRGLDCVLVVVDNDGGGIFSFLPQAGAVQAESFERLWGTPHGLDICAVAAAYGVETTSAPMAADVGPAVLAALAAGGVRVVYVRTSRAANVEVHAEIQAAVAAAVRSAVT